MYLSLLIEYETFDEINQMIQRNFIKRCKFLQEEKRKKKLNLTQCFNCYNYEH